MTTVTLAGRTIVIVLTKGPEFIQHLALCQDLPVRKFNKKTSNWEVPIECASDILLRFLSLKEADIHPSVVNRALSHNDLIKNKFIHEPGDEIECLVKTPMLKHQHHWLGFSKHFKAVANLCEQGTGKSKMALDWIAAKKLNLVLLVAKNSNVYKWCQEVDKHSDFSAYLLKGDRRNRLHELEEAKKDPYTAIVVINYEYVQPFLRELSQVNFDGIVLDESTAIKNVSSKRHKAIIKLGARCAYKLILTGTPLVNSPIDAFGQFRFLNENILGANFVVFKSRYTVMGGYGGYKILVFKNLHELQAKIEQYSYRVLKQDCLDLPDKVFQVYDIEASDDFMAKYRDLVKAELIELGDRVADNTLMLSKIVRCQQLCDGFLYEDSQLGLYKILESPKMSVLLDFVEDHFQSSGRLIIWAKYKASLKEMYATLSKKFPHIKFDVISGETPVNSRQSLVDAFNVSYANDNQMRCLCLQTASMMHGVDIRCDTAVYYSLGWNNEEWLQSQDRIHGINRGFGNKCTYIIFAIPGTIEATILKALDRKKTLSDYVLKDKNTMKDILTGGVNGE